MADLKPPEVERAISCESEASCYSDARSQFNDEDDDRFNDDDEYEYYIGDDATFIDKEEDSEAFMHPWLFKDMEHLLLIYGERSLRYRLFESIDEIDVELHIPISFLEPETAEAWKVLREEPLIVRLHFSLSRYIESSNVPKLEVFQPSKKEGFGFGAQVCKFAENFLSGQWPELSQNYKKCVAEQNKAKKSQSYPTGFTKGSSQKEILRINDDDIAKLMGMGFDASMARNALIITRGNVHEASNLILTNPDTCSSDSVGSFEEDEDTVQRKPPKPKRQQSHPPLLKQLKKMLPSLTRQSSMIPSATDSNIAQSCPIEDLNLMPLSTLDGKNAKKVPSLDDGFLVQLFRYVRQRIPTMNEYCVVCDEPHVFQNGAMLKLAVCSRELCVFAFQTLGVMANAAEDIATGAEVVDLLLNMTRAAAKSNRKAVIFDPFPTIVDPKNPTHLLFNPKQKDINAVERVMNMIPSMSEMTTMTANLRKELDSRDLAVYPLMQWIITSNRSHIVKLPPERQLNFMYTPHQFLLLSSPPAKEAVFREERAKHGSTFAFHGSSIENWHSIIRQGLLNASGTRLQVNGAAYGKGIYLSPHIATSMGYSRMGYATHNIKKKAGGAAVSNSAPQRFLSSDNITCIAICEVITSPNLKKNNAIWVCPDPDHVCTRFFFVYEDGKVSDSSIDTQKEQYKKELVKACNYKM